MYRWTGSSTVSMDSRDPMNPWSRPKVSSSHTVDTFTTYLQHRKASRSLFLGDRSLLLFIGDLISAVEYDPTGQFIALGDTGGRITILERNNVQEPGQKKGSTEVRLHTRFQSHLPEFDYLKSVEIEEKINPMVWLKRINQHNMMLAANDKTIKMWKIRSQPSGAGVGFRRNGGPCATQSPMQVGQHDMGFQVQPCMHGHLANYLASLAH